MCVCVCEKISIFILRDMVHIKLSLCERDVIP